MSQIVIDEFENGFIVHLSGQFTGGKETDDLLNYISIHCTPPKNNIIINLQDVTYLSSIALGIFVKTNANVIKHQGNMVFCNVNEVVQNLFDITKVNSYFQITDSIESAKAALPKD